MRRPATLHTRLSSDSLSQSYTKCSSQVFCTAASLQGRPLLRSLRQSQTMHSNYAGSPICHNALHLQQGVQIPMGATGDLRLAPDQFQQKDKHGIRPSDAATARTQQIPHTRG